MKELLEKFEEFKKANDERLAQIEKNGAARADLEAKVKTLNDEVTRLNTEAEKAMHEAQAATKAAEAAELIARQRFDSEGGKDKASTDPKVKQAFNKFIRKGASELSAEEKHAMSSYSDPDGGYLILPEFSKEIIEKQYLTSPMRTIATVETISSNLYKQPRENSLAAASWKDREVVASDTGTPKYGFLEIVLHELEAHPKVPQNLIDDASWDVEARLKRSLGTAFGLAENTGFVTGDGKGMPRGILSYASGTNPDLGQIQQVTSGNGSAITPDKLIALVYTLKQGYRSGASWVMNALTQAAIRQLKDTTNQYLWQPGLQSGQPATLLGYPITEFADMPDVAASSLSIAFANFKEAYKIVDNSRGMRITPNPYINPGFMVWNTFKRVGGEVANFEAIKLMVTSA